MNLNAQHQFTEAEPLLRKALEICGRVLGPDHPSTAASYNNVASNLDDQDRFAEAEPLHRKALGDTRAGARVRAPRYGRELQQLCNEPRCPRPGGGGRVALLQGVRNTRAGARARSSRYGRELQQHRNEPRCPRPGGGGRAALAQGSGDI